MLALVSLLLVPAQRPTDVVKWTVHAPAVLVSAGETVNLQVTAQIQPGWKLYAIAQPAGGPKPLVFATAAGSKFRVDAKKIGAPKPKVLKQDENFAVDTHYYEDEARFTIPVSLPRTIVAGAHEVPLEVTFQACGQELCLRPFTQKLAVGVTIRP